MWIFAFVVALALILYRLGDHRSQAEAENRTVKVLDKDYQALGRQVPAAAAAYCIDLWKLNAFSLKIKGSRKTKLGDFRVDRSGTRVSISVNGTLNPYAFLLTYLHEVAHLLTWQKHKSGVKPHGSEWQAQFQLLMQPMLNIDIFPQEVLTPLRHYMQAPAASSSAHQPLWIALRAFDEQLSENVLLLSQIPDGNKFRFSQTVYQKVEVRRTRALCYNLSNGRRYLISTAAQVEQVA